MCGIIGYIGKRQAAPILLQGLRRLEYRGYDSSGMAISDHSTLAMTKCVGKIENLAEKMKTSHLPGSVGIAHTRWATHGGVTELNAHPHTGNKGKLVLVHNGIIENYRELKDQLGPEHHFTSETDSEVLAHLIEREFDLQEQKNCEGLRKAVGCGLSHVKGTYGIVVMHEDVPDCLITARMGSPIVVGVGKDENYIASDATPILAYTRDVLFLDDGEIAEVKENNVRLFTLKDEIVSKKVEEIHWNDEQAEKQGFPHFMLKEIHDQPTVFEDAIRGRFNMAEGTAVLGGLNMTEQQMRDINRVIFIACGTASYAGMVGKYAFERLAGIPAEVDVASEFRYRDPIIDEKTLVFVMSQSGETADTLAALREAKRKGAFVRGIVNVIGSTISRETDGGTYIHAGAELAVASTKAYTNMVTVALLYALQFGRARRVSIATGQRMLNAFLEIPEKMNWILSQKDSIKEIAEKYKDYKNFLFLGRGINYPVALEGSLKLKEISYIHAEAYPGGEMKHGPLALISEDFPTFAIMPQNQLYEKMRSNIEEIRARKGKVILIATQGDERAKELAEDVIYVPAMKELLEPLLNTIPLQLFSYYVAVALKRDVDRPRNLAKSVTVE
ncbi:MAG: glutamine--fructose-6-phosphate transaminase (isomerizing) [Candidatus Magasanikbacteria bacterium CG11_big_fil_rev_8_21_14_0_20_39_34]|uniref:Glutamine--fructose-6-phosphate aminotransferase [isomerizing] n=1 Tax=Candidatus Magasanikbacteria bacterium CG11_big_fil_rev_8_21_14_0_20_39_34 TaxID=1974653 RepID=A0A2H0N5Z8_9BACT|nr:MAG: glutamine--fructose-6-phosphate transaminase (isomerizing) [Candidatus Magasanikbacteria bacterium CG11_big_fil_rev_8_21_14_0_20_39_34]